MPIFGTQFNQFQQIHSRYYAQAFILGCISKLDVCWNDDENKKKQIFRCVYWSDWLFWNEWQQLPWSNMDFAYSSNCGPRIRKFDNSNAILSGLHWPTETEWATFSTNVISSSTAKQSTDDIQNKIQTHYPHKKKTIKNTNYLLVCNSYVGVAMCDCRLALFVFNGRGASKFFNVRLTCDIFSLCYFFSVCFVLYCTKKNIK